MIPTWWNNTRVQILGNWVPMSLLLQMLLTGEFLLCKYVIWHSSTNLHDCIALMQSVNVQNQGYDKWREKQLYIGQWWKWCWQDWNNEDAYEVSSTLRSGIWSRRTYIRITSTRGKAILPLFYLLAKMYLFNKNLCWLFVLYCYTIHNFSPIQFLKLLVTQKPCETTTPGKYLIGYSLFLLFLILSNGCLMFTYAFNFG
jgi:hypothetical protein